MIVCRLSIPHFGVKSSMNVGMVIVSLPRVAPVGASGVHGDEHHDPYHDDITP